MNFVLSCVYVGALIWWLLYNIFSRANGEMSVQFFVPVRIMLLCALVIGSFATRIWLKPYNLSNWSAFLGVFFGGTMFVGYADSVNWDNESHSSL